MIARYQSHFVFVVDPQIFTKLKNLQVITTDKANGLLEHLVLYGCNATTVNSLLVLITVEVQTRG
jgi:hypothetical protein